MSEDLNPELRELMHNLQLANTDLRQQVATASAQKVEATRLSADNTHELECLN
jgi:hypothetical protein